MVEMEKRRSNERGKSHVPQKITLHICNPFHVSYLIRFCRARESYGKQYTRRKSLKTIFTLGFYKRDPAKMHLFDFVWKCHLHIRTYPHWTLKPTRPRYGDSGGRSRCSRLKRRRSGLWGAWVGPLHADPTAPVSLILAGGLTNKKCWRSVHFSEMPHTARQKVLSWFLTTSKPQAGNRKQMSSMECFAPGNFSSLCFHSKGTEGMEQEHKRTLFFFFIGSNRKPLQDGEKKAGVAALTNMMLPRSVSVDDPRPSTHHQGPSLSTADL